MVSSLLSLLLREFLAGSTSPSGEIPEMMLLDRQDGLEIASRLCRVTKTFAGSCEDPEHLCFYPSRLQRRDTPI